MFFSEEDEEPPTSDGEKTAPRKGKPDLKVVK
jgi:hypothetical protein